MSSARRFGREDVDSFVSFEVFLLPSASFSLFTVVFLFSARLCFCHCTMDSVSECVRDLLEPLELAFGRSEETQNESGQDASVAASPSTSSGSSTSTAPAPVAPPPRRRVSRNLSASAKGRVADWLDHIDTELAFPFISATAGAE